MFRFAVYHSEDSRSKVEIGRQAGESEPPSEYPHRILNLSAAPNHDSRSYHAANRRTGFLRDPREGPLQLQTPQSKETREQVDRAGSWPHVGSVQKAVVKTAKKVERTVRAPVPRSLEPAQAVGAPMSWGDQPIGGQ